MADKDFPVGGGELESMANIVKHAQKMQKDILKVQDELKDKTVSASSGGGAVMVVANARKELQKVEIKPDAIDPRDPQTLEDLILTAVNNCLEQADQVSENEINRITGGLNLNFDDFNS